MNPISAAEEKGLREFEDSFGAVFSFPVNANNATAYIKGNTGVPQAYAGRWDNETIKSFLRSYTKDIIRAVRDAVPDEFVPPIKFQPDYTTAAWNQCRAAMLKTLNDFLGKEV